MGRFEAKRVYCSHHKRTSEWANERMAKGAVVVVPSLVRSFDLEFSWTRMQYSEYTAAVSLNEGREVGYFAWGAVREMTS
jgi:hypothetical protein